MPWTQQYLLRYWHWAGHLARRQNIAQRLCLHRSTHWKTMVRHLSDSRAEVWTGHMHQGRHVTWEEP
eukprot:4387355-Alexandrium_andersonii.AAC.1